MFKKLMSLFTTPDARALAELELAEAERRLLAAQNGVEYATAMVTYNKARVVRLRSFLASAS